MNTPIEPPAEEPTTPPQKAITPLETTHDGSAATASPSDAEHKDGSVFTKGLKVCGNCGTELLGDTCYQCGQPTKGLVRQFSSIMGDFLDTVLNIDTRVFRTIGPLIYKPGFLTQEYFSGRRIRYVSPVRLFFFLAVLTFLLAQFSLPDDMASNQGNSPVQVNANGDDKIGRAKTIDEVERVRSHALEQLDEAKKDAAGVPMVGAAFERAKTDVNLKADKKIADLKSRMTPEMLAQLKPAKPVSPTKPAVDQTNADMDDEGNISFNGELWDAKKNPIKVSWLPDAINKWFNSLTERAQKNGKRVNKDPKVIIDALLSALPMTLFLMLPVFALLLKIMFIFKRRLYMEHLIVALHSHAFLMLSILLLIFFNDMSAWFSGAAWLTAACGMLTAILWIWMPIYLFLMQKRVYQQGWMLTFIKFAVIGNLHIVLLSMAITCTLIIKMIWL
ncbi:MAG: DUF3667 domain-containing protein [Arenimonas sp.]